ncbi:DUF4123 domain-containing protein [Pyxidicoccus sp. 3LG]
MTGKAERHAIVQVRWGPMAYRKAIVAPGQSLRVGRAESAEFVVPHDTKLADAHFEVSWDGTRGWVKDLGTRTGTQLGGQRVEQAELTNGIWLRAGRTDFSVYFERTTPPPKALTEDSSEITASKEQALKVLQEQKEPLYAILDAARSERILELLRESVEEHWSLYEGTQGEALADVAPYLVQLTSDSMLLEALVREGWTQSWGIYLTCTLAPLEVRRHFRKLLMVEAEDIESKLYFRFYDPRTMQVFITTRTEPQRPELPTPISHFMYEGRNKELQHVPSGEQKLLGRPHATRAIKISNHELHLISNKIREIELEKIKDHAKTWQQHTQSTNQATNEAVNNAIQEFNHHNLQNKEALEDLVTIILAKSRSPKLTALFTKLQQAIASLPPGETHLKELALKYLAQAATRSILPSHKTIQP